MYLTLMVQQNIKYLHSMAGLIIWGFLIYCCTHNLSLLYDTTQFKHKPGTVNKKKATCKNFLKPVNPRVLYTYVMFTIKNYHKILRMYYIRTCIAIYVNRYNYGCYHYEKGQMLYVPPNGGLMLISVIRSWNYRKGHA